jgi:hypothetical protein
MRILASISVPFRPTTVQMPNLALNDYFAVVIHFQWLTVSPANNAVSGSVQYSSHFWVGSTGYTLPEVHSQLRSGLWWVSPAKIVEDYCISMELLSEVIFKAPCEYKN